MKKHITVYRVIRDPSYQKLIPVDDEAFQIERSRSWSFSCRRKDHKTWVELEMQPSNSSLKKPDIWEIVPGAFAVERVVMNELCNSITETQPSVKDVKCEGRKLAVVNSTLCIDCLNKDESVVDRDDFSKIERYVFDGSILAISLFKIPQTKEFELFTLDGFDVENDFKTLVEKFGFTGLIFETVWSGESFMDA